MTAGATEERHRDVDEQRLREKLRGRGPNRTLQYVYCTQIDSEFIVTFDITSTGDIAGADRTRNFYGCFAIAPGFVAANRRRCSCRTCSRDSPVCLATIPTSGCSGSVGSRM